MTQASSNLYALLFTGLLLSAALQSNLAGADPALAKRSPQIVAAPTTLEALRNQNDAALYSGLVKLRSRENPEVTELVGDNSDRYGMRWTKCTNVALDLIATLVAERRRLTSSGEASLHIEKVLAVLGRVRTFNGIFPEVWQLEGGPRAEVKDGRIRFSSIDSAWLTLALTLVQARYESTNLELSNAAQSLVRNQDYTAFVHEDGLMGGGFWVDERTNRRAEEVSFSYGDRNSEARPLVLALVGLGKLPESAWTKMQYGWATKEGLNVARGFHFSAFVEMTGALFFDERALAPRSLGRSHATYLEATQRVARRNGHKIWGYAPSCDLHGGYTEHGLDQPGVVTPYAAAELAMSSDPRAVENLSRVLASWPRDGAPAPDGLDPVAGQASCTVARTLDQALLFLALNVDTVRELAANATWYASAVRRLREMDGQATRGGAGVRSGAFESQSSRLRELLASARAADSRAGETAVAESRAALAEAAASKTWLEFLPSLSLAVRKQVRLESATSATDATWRVELQARASLSLAKYYTGVAASNAASKAHLQTRQATHETFVRALGTYFSLYLAERRLARVEQHQASWQQLSAGVEQGLHPGSASDAILMRARGAALAEDIVVAEGKRQVVLSELRAELDSPIDSSGLDPSYDLSEVLVLIESVSSTQLSSEQAVADADVAVQTSLARAAQSRVWYLPAIQPSLFVALPSRSGDTPSSPAQRESTTEQVTGELALTFDMTPGDASLSRARQATVLRSRLLAQQVREHGQDTLNASLAQLGAERASWVRGDTRAAAETLYQETARRFMRGESRVTELVNESAALMSAESESEAVFANAVGLEILASASAAPEAEATAAPNHALDRSVSRGAGSSPRVKAAWAELGRVRAERDAERWPFQLGLETGLLYPLYTSAGSTPAPAGQVPGGPSALFPERLRDPSILARVSMTISGRGGEARAANAAVSWKYAQVASSQKRVDDEAARAALSAAYAQAVLSNAEAVAESAGKLFASLQEQVAQGFLNDQTLIEQARLRLGQAKRAVEHQRGVALAAQTATARTPIHGPLATGNPRLFADWLARVYYPAQGLTGYRAQPELATTALEATYADARLRAIRNPPASVSLSAQGTQGLQGRDYSLGFSVNFTLDPVKNAAKILQAAAESGAAEGRRQVASAALAAAQATARSELEQANEELAIALGHERRLVRILSDTQQEAELTTAVHDSVKVRALGALLIAQLEARSRVLAAEQRMSLAQLEALSLSVSPQISNKIPGNEARTEGLHDSIATLSASDPERIVALSASNAVNREPSRLPVIAGLHLAGPSLGAYYGAVRDPDQPVTARTIGGAIGVGASFGLSEAFSFVAEQGRRNSAKLGVSAAARRARARALTALARAWAARNLKRVAEARERLTRSRLERRALPLYATAQLGASALVDAEAMHAAAMRELVRADAQLQRLLDGFALRGVKVDDPTLDELDRFAAVSGAQPTASAFRELSRRTAATSPELARARAEHGVASADTALAALGVIGPLTAFAELRPIDSSVERADTGAPGVNWERDTFLLSSLIVPVELKAIAETVEASYRTHVRSAELSALEKNLGAASASLETAVVNQTRALDAAHSRTVASQAAFQEVRSRYEAGSDGTSADTVSLAEDAALEAEQNEWQARAGLLDVRAEVESLSESL